MTGRGDNPTDKAFSLRVGILCPDQGLQAWQQNSVERLFELSFVDICLVIVNRGPQAQSSQFDPGVGSGVAKAPLAAWIENLLKPHGLRIVGLCEALQGLPVIELREAQATSALVREFSLDLVLCFSSGQITEDLISAVRFGVWRYRFGSAPDQSRDLPWLAEIRSEVDTAEIRLVMLTLGGGEHVLREASIQTVKRSYGATLKAALSAAAHLPAQVCIELKNAGLPVLRNKSYLPEPGRQSAPALRFAIAAIAMMLKHRIKWLIHGISRSETWTLGIVDKPIENCLEDDFLQEITVLPAIDRTRYLADGFGVEIGGRRFVLCEQFDYRVGKGAIVWLELDSGARVIAGPNPAFESPVHASFPYIFRHNERIFCCPETWKAGHLTLWEALEPPANWRPRCELLAGVPAVDPVIFQHEDLWWLFCSREDDQPNAKLYAWYAEQLEGPWRPHDLNPVKIDVRSARSAGTPFRSDGVLYRPAQDCSRTYGGRISINRVTKLSPFDFAEKTARIIDPPHKSGFHDGIHTISSLGEATLIDVKREQFNPTDLWLKVRKLLRNALN